MVKGWRWADIELDDRHHEEIRIEGIYPCFVYASYIIEDQTGRWDVGLCVRTTLAVEFHKNYLSATRNTVYVLVGKGTRMTVAPGVFTSLTF